MAEKQGVPSGQGPNLQTDPLMVSESGIASVKGAPDLVRAGQAVKQAVGQMSPLEKTALATAPVPVVGDIAGVAADIDMYANRPEERTGLNYLMSAVGLLPFVPGAAQLRAGKTMLTAPGARIEDTVTDLNVKFKSEYPAFENLGVSHVSPNPEGITRFNAIDNPTGDSLGIVRVTVPTDDVYRASGGKYTGSVSDSHDSMFMGGEKGLEPTEISRRNVELANAEEELIEGIMYGDIKSGLPKSFDAQFPDVSEADPKEIQEWLNSNSDWVRQKALGIVRDKEVMGSADLPKNTPVGFARFADVEVEGKPYMRITEIQSDMFAEARKAEADPEAIEGWGQNVTFATKEGQKIPELYPNMAKNDMPLKSSVLKGAVASAIERGSNGIVLPNKFTSAARERYSDSNVKKLLKKTISDLGEGFSYRKVDLPSYYKDDLTFSEHYVLEWPDLKEAPTELKFATGGLVSLPPRTGDGIVGMIKKYRREGLMD
jgi:hypothetical protein